MIMRQQHLAEHVASGCTCQQQLVLGVDLAKLLHKQALAVLQAMTLINHHIFILEL